MAAWRAPFAIVSHGVEENPIFNFGNHVALELFELDFDAFTKLPSVQSAEPLAREEREQLLATVSTQGFIANYSGVRISATGKRFQIENAIVWNIVDNKGAYYGQAATFEHGHTYKITKLKTSALKAQCG